MRVALTFPGCHRRGGVERILFECAKFLVGAGHDVHVFASDFESSEQSNGFQRHLVPQHPRPWFLRGADFYSSATASLREFDYDILSTHGCVCPTGGVHWVQSLHAAWLHRSRQFRKTLSLATIKRRLNPLHPILLRLEAAHFRKRAYTKVIATTEQVRQDLHSYYDVPLGDIAIVPNGYSPTEFSPRIREQLRKPMRQRLGLAENEVAILFAANELERKGYRVLLSAIRALARRDIKLLVVGRVSAGEVMRQAEREGLGQSVIPCGSTSNIAEFHAAADMFVLPTQYEAFCLAILEALGSGLPVITTAIPGAQDAVREGINGLLIHDPLEVEAFVEAIRQLLCPVRREQMSQAAPDTVRGYQWPSVLHGYEDILLNYASSAMK